MKTAIKRLLNAAATLYRQYPARANSYILAAVVAVGGALGVVIDPESAGAVLKAVVPLLLAGEATHRLVSPVRKGN